MPVYVNPKTSYFDKLFQNTPFDSCKLIVQISLHDITLLIYHVPQNKYIGIESFRLVGLNNENQIENELDSLIEQREWVIAQFKNVNVIFTDPVSTLIPQALFDKKEKELYMDFNNSIPDDQLTRFDLLKSLNTINLFRFPRSLEKKINTVWPGSALLHSSSVLIESLFINYRNKTDNNTLFVQVYNDFFELVYFKDNKLYYHNTFQFKSKEDFIYFLLSAIEQLNLNPEDVNIILSGLIDKKSIYYEMVVRYIRNNTFIERNDTFKYAYPFDKLQYHKYYVLFNLLQCE